MNQDSIPQWMVIHSTAVSHNGAAIAFSITRGLAEKGQPELAMYGVNSDDAQIVLNRAAEWLLRGELPFDVPVLGLINAALVVKRVPLEKSVGCFGGEQTAPVKNMLQLVVPDPNNRFPWEEGFDPSYDWLQLKLYE